MTATITLGPDLDEAAADALVVPVLAGLAFGPGADRVAARLGEWLEPHLEQAGFTGGAGEVASVPGAGAVPWNTVVFVGLGDEVDLEGLRRAAGAGARAARRASTVATTLHAVDLDGATRACVEGFLLGWYRFSRHHSMDTETDPGELVLAAPHAADAVGAVTEAKTVAAAVTWARDLVNEPAAGKAPEGMALLASGQAARRRIEVEVLDEAEMRRLALGGVLGVAAGSHRPPRLIRCRYRPEGATSSLALVGKGVVFDSGGLSLKTAQQMEAMKTDMAGAATVLAALWAVADLHLPVAVTVIAPLVENMPGGGATRPGDVLRARNGKTIEVLNTDAEGRLILADGLVLAGEEDPDLVVDVATLTGACKVALGERIGGLFSNDDVAAAAVGAAAAAAGERLWRLPLPDDYRKNLDSDVADMKNTGGRFGGAINAALLLREFVGDRPWVHLDVAGPARWPEEEHYQSKGGSGFGVRTLVELARSLAGR